MLSMITRLPARHVLARPSLFELLSVKESSAASPKCHFRVRRFGRLFGLPYKFSAACQRENTIAQTHTEGDMPPKKAVSETGMVEPEGVPYSINLTSKIVVVGSGLVSNSERDTFKQKATPSLDEH